MNPFSPKRTRQPWDFILLIALFTILALTVLAQANPGTEYPGRDSGAFIYIGKQIVKGHLPYHDLWDSKPPGIFYLNALALRLGRGMRWGIWLVEFGFLFSAIAASYHLLKNLWGTGSAIFGIFTWLWGLNFVLEGGNFTEEYPMVLHFLALILLLKLIQNPGRRLFYFALGLFSSISFLFRPNNAVVEALVILFLGASLLVKREWKTFSSAVLWVTLGILLPLAISFAYFAHLGVLQEMIEASFIYNLTYGATKFSSYSPLQVGFDYLNLAAWIGLVGYVLLLLQIGKIFKSPHFLLFMVMIIGTPIAIFVSDLARRSYGHYFINWLPFIALLSAFAFLTVQEKFPPPKKNQPAQPSFFPLLSSIFVALALFALSGSASKYAKALDRFFNSPDRELRSPISIYVENHTNPGETVLFWATHPGENFMARRDAPMSNLFYPILVDSEISDRLNDDFLEDLKNNTPVLVVDMQRLTIPSLDPARREEQKIGGIYPANPPHNLDEVLQFIEENYYLEAIIKDKPVYRLHGTAGP